MSHSKQIEIIQKHYGINKIIMSKNSELAITEAENFYSRLKENEEYATVSMRMYMLDKVKISGGSEVDFTVHGVKSNNPKFKEDRLLKGLYSDKRKLNNKITEREQNINQSKK